MHVYPVTMKHLQTVALSTLASRHLHSRSQLHRPPEMAFVWMCRKGTFTRFNPVPSSDVPKGNQARIVIDLAISASVAVTRMLTLDIVHLERYHTSQPRQRIRSLLNNSKASHQ